jgi:cation diffusion facilitator family transporter
VDADRPPEHTTAGADGSHTGRRAVIAAFLANLGIAAAKFVGFLATGAASMLAEAIHSVADTANQALLLFGRRRARRAPTTEHPFGFSRERYFWAFVVALILFTGGSLFALVEGEEKLRQPHEVESAGWAIAILLVAAALEALSLRTGLAEARPERGRRSWWSFIRRSKTPELPVVLLEDTGALIGLLFALVGIGLAHVTGDARYDALGSIAIGLLLGFIAITLAIETKSMLIGESADPDTVASICEVIASSPGVRSIVDLRTEHLGPDRILVVGRVELAAAGDDAGRTIADIEARVRDRLPAVAYSYLEPVPGPTPGT